VFAAFLLHRKLRDNTFQARKARPFAEMPRGDAKRRRLKVLSRAQVEKKVVGAV
jgi:hypothetical protein